MQKLIIYLCIFFSFYTYSVPASAQTNERITVATAFVPTQASPEDYSLPQAPEEIYFRQPLAYARLATLDADASFKLGDRTITLETLDPLRGTLIFGPSSSSPWDFKDTEPSTFHQLIPESAVPEASWIYCGMGVCLKDENHDFIFDTAFSKSWGDQHFLGIKQASLVPSTKINISYKIEKNAPSHHAALSALRILRKPGTKTTVPGVSLAVGRQNLKDYSKAANYQKVTAGRFAYAVTHIFDAEHMVATKFSLALGKLNEAGTLNSELIKSGASGLTYFVYAEGVCSTAIDRAGLNCTKAAQ